jgi:LacI family transcriptional regulator
LTWPAQGSTLGLLKPISEIDSRTHLRRPSAADVARTAGVSKATVSRVLKGDERYIRAETRRRVLDAARSLNYRSNLVAASMRTRRTRSITLIIPDITNPYWPEVARGVQDRAAASHYAVSLANTDWRPERESDFISLAERSMVEGLIVNPSGPLDAILAHGIPTVVIGSRAEPSTVCDVVGSDTYGGMRLATAHLAERGHHRIAFIGGLGAGATTPPDRGIRAAGFRDEIAARGLALDPALIVAAPYSIDGGRGAALGLLQLSEPPTAIVGANDLLAVGALLAARELGLTIPRDLSIVGSDDIPLAAAAWPGLTTVVKPKYDLGQIACELLLDRLVAPSSSPGGRRLILPVSLIERGTVAPPSLPHD